MEQPVLNEHNKSDHRPSHTAEHLLNQTMVRMFGCERSKYVHASVSMWNPLGQSVHSASPVQAITKVRSA